MTEPLTIGCADPAADPTQSAAAPQRFLVNTTAETQAANARLVAAAIALLSGVWLALVAQPAWLRGVGGVSCVFGLLWAARHLRQRRAAHAADPRAQHYLEIGEHHLALVDGPQARSIPLAEIEQVEIDNDRLEVVLQLRDQDPVRIEPRYQGLGLRALAERLYNAVLAERERAQP